MPQIRVASELNYFLEEETSFCLSITAARTPHQIVEFEQLDVPPDVTLRSENYGPEGYELIRLNAPPGPLKINYQADVLIDAQITDPFELHEVPFSEVPPSILTYLNPSRYCESDKLNGFVMRHFGDITPGYQRVRAISDWVESEFAYVAGITDGSSSTTDVMLQRAGVCRDFAHVGISLCRALGIPARYVTGYGIGVEPQDFHGFFEAWLDDDWYLFDPTGMAPEDGLVRIGAGRDAADAPFATYVGNAILESKFITVQRLDTFPDFIKPRGALSTA